MKTDTNVGSHSDRGSGYFDSDLDPSFHFDADPNPLHKLDWAAKIQAIYYLSTAVSKAVKRISNVFMLGPNPVPDPIL